MKKRVFSILLCLCMAMAFMPQMVFAGEGTSSGVYIFFDSSKFSDWTAPFYAYIYDEDTDPDKTYSNAAFPGQTMQIDPATGYYFIEVSDSSCIAASKSSGESTASNFDLAYSKNTCVIISDSDNHQYPRMGSPTKLQLGVNSKLLSGTTTSDWNTIVPSTITYNLNGGTINSGNVTVYINGQGAVLPTDVTKAGYTFAGWYEDKDFSGNPVMTISNTDTGNKVFYAKYIVEGTSGYKIIEGANGSWTQNSDGTLTFRADGDFGKFTGVNVDDELIDANNYTAISGSTVITLNTNYLKTLSVGTHKLSVVYTDGECSTNFEVKRAVSELTEPTEGDIIDTETSTSNKDSKADAEDSAKTGDNTNLALWIALMLISGAGIGGTCLYTRRKRTNE
ncbi:MAG: InlB B-repeat-containing protein [Bacillota bacterium]|nr:InlB B-repeat-containing protein [Bacillota bacterium]